MKGFAKFLSVFISLADYGVGIAVALILFLKKNFFAVILIPGMSYNELLFFNMAVFTAILAGIAVVLNLLIGEYHRSDTVTEFPIVFEIVPVIITAICIFFAFQGDTAREKVLVILFSLLYAVLSAVVILFSSRVFQLFPKEKKTK